MSQQAIVPQLVEQSEYKSVANALALFLGVLLLSLLAQVSIPLPWTPVPITGQTFGVTLIALAWGRKRAFAIVASYLLIGAAGLPVFALGKSGFVFGPTSGYLLGMLVSSFVVGWMADRGATNSFAKALGAGFLGSFIVLLCGVCVLSYFIQNKELLLLGVVPFIPGDIIKTVSAAFLSTKVRKTFAPNENRSV
jgi:biotin transport system substrate-specific component